MPKKVQFIVKIIFLAAFVLVACGPEATPTPVFVPPVDLEILPDAQIDPDILGLLACNFQTGANSSKAPCADNPGACSPSPNEVIAGLQPSFTWDNPYTCGFDYWELQVVRNDPSFPDNGINMELFKVLPNETLSYAMTEDLEPNTRYKWQIMPSEYMYGMVRSTTKHTAFFWTGPICTPFNLQKPVIFAPLDGAEFTGFWQINLKAAHPDDCGAEIYEYEMSENVDFSAPLIDGFYTSTLPLINGLGDSLDDCTRYYWRLRGLVGTDEGPWSNTRFFTTSFGGFCPSIFDLLLEIPEDWQYPDWPFLPAVQDLNCREGDSTSHRNIGTARMGEYYQILAVNRAYTHVRLLLPTINVRCWVFLGEMMPWLGGLPINPEDLMNFVAMFDPLAPTATPTAAPALIPPTPTPTIDAIIVGHVCQSPSTAAVIQRCVETCPDTWFDTGQTCTLP